jgi:hypothetical protein
MAEEQSPSVGPDLTQGVALAELPMESWQVMWASRRSCWSRAGPRYLPSRRIADIIMARSVKGS